MTDTTSAAPTTVVGEKFQRAWVQLDQLPGTMMVGPEGRFGPIPASTSAWITTSEEERDRCLSAGKPMLEVWLAAAPKAAQAQAAVAGLGQETCQSCQGNGEIVTNWERYKHPSPRDRGDEAVAECQDCDGRGVVDAAPTTQATPQPAAQQGDELPREDFAWLVVQEACETEPADEDDPECIRILRRDLKSAVLSAFLRHDAAHPAAPAAVASPLTKLQRKAIAVCFTSDKVSVSEVQRKLSISYADAQTLCQSIVDLGLTDELELAPSLKRGAPASQPAPVAQGDAEDAARYRFLAGHCRSTSEHWGGRWSIIVDGPAPKSHDSEDDFDEAVDAARKQGGKP